MLNLLSKSKSRPTVTVLDEGTSKHGFPVKEEAPASSIRAELQHQWVKTKQGMDCMLHIWSPRNVIIPKAVVVMFHGLGGHGMYPTMKYFSDLLAAEAKVAVYVMDLPGHGQSYGRRGYLESVDRLLEDAMVAVEHAQCDYKNVPLFLAGNSMGGAIALLLSLRVELPDSIQGLILMAPMISLPVNSFQSWGLRQLHSMSPTMGLFKPPSSAAEYTIRDRVRRKEAKSDPHAYKGGVRVASALTCLALTKRIKEQMDQVSCPVLCLLAEEDYVVNNEGIDEFMGVCKSTDKTLREYDALHSLLCEEEPLRSQIERDIMGWIEERTGSYIALLTE